MTQDNRRTWKCTECLSKQPKSDNTNTPLRSIQNPPQTDSEDPVVLETECSNNNITKRKTTKKTTGCDKLEPSDIKKLIKETFTELFSEDLTSIKKQLTEFQTSLNYFNNIFEDLKEENNDLKKAQSIITTDLKILKDENVNLKRDLKSYELRVKKIEEDSSRQQQWTRLQNVEIVGVPESKDEITIDVVKKVMNCIGVSVESEDLEFAHRVQPRRATSAKKGRAIVLRLRDRALRDKIIAAARKRRNMSANEMGFGGENGYIYINEHLTVENKALLVACKSKAKELIYKYVWTKNCRIFMRRNDTSPPIPISSVSDLQRIA